MPMTIMFS